MQALVLECHAATSMTHERANGRIATIPPLGTTQSTGATRSTSSCNIIIAQHAQSVRAGKTRSGPLSSRIIEAEAKGKHLTQAAGGACA